MTHQAPNPGDPAYDWSDPHGFHHDAEGHETAHQHHVSTWQLQVGVLIALLALTFLTVLVAKGEAFVLTYTDFPITQLWNVIIAMVIATIKAMLVCMYFMHLRHDNALNTWVLLFTFGVLIMFLLMPAIDTASRGIVDPQHEGQVLAGGTGAPGRATGEYNDEGKPVRENIEGSIIDYRREEYIAAHGAREYWFHFYDYKAEKYHHAKLPKRHEEDAGDYYAKWKKQYLKSDDYMAKHGGPPTSTANSRVVRTGLTPGLFGTAEESDGGSAGESHDEHGGDHGSADDH